MNKSLNESLNESLNPYDDIDFCLETLYDAVYSGDNLYRLEPIVRQDIKISNLRKDHDFNYKKVLESKFISKGYYNDRLHYERFGIYPSMMSIGFCNKKINLNDQLRPELYHMAMLYMGTELFFDEQYNHTELPLMCFDIKKNDLLKYLPNIEKDFGEFFQKDNDNMYIILTEHYHKTITLREYLDENKDNITVEQIKSILFQIYFTLIKLNERFNKFRHNKLNLDSILICPKKPKDDVYKLQGITYNLRNNTLDVKITDFDYSYHNSEYIKNDNYIIKFEGGNTDNPYFDIHYITNLLYLYFENNKKNENIYKILKLSTDFFNEIVPVKYRINNIKNFKGLNIEEYNKSSEEIITPIKIIKKNIFFGNFIMNNIKESIENLNVKDSSIKYIESDFLNKFQNKKSNQYYSNMIKGSRKIQGLDLTESNNSDMEGGVRKHLGLSATSTMRSDVSHNKSSKKSSKKSKKHEAISSTSFTFTERSDRTIVNPQLTSDESRRKSKNKKQSRKNKFEDASIKKSSSSSSSKSSKSSSSKSSSSSSSDDKKMRRSHKDGQQLEYINFVNEKDRKKLEKLPEGYMDVAPDHMIQNMPNLEQQQMVSDMGGQFDQMQMNPMMPPGMPPAMPPNMPPNMPGNLPQQALQQMQTPPMPAELQQIAMQAQMGGPGMAMPNMGPMNSQLNVPMMNNPMAQMMGMQPPMQMGGGKMTKYKLKLDKKFFF
jgi:hypothetical protein